MNTKADLINAIGKHRKFETYLEISTPTTGNVYDRVSPLVFKEKTILLYRDRSQRGKRRPDTNAPVTEEYQKSIDALISAGKKYDVIFVDSFHTFEQSKIDIENAVRLVSANGAIVIHDCAPIRFETATPYYIAGEWYGHTYKALLHFRISCALNMCVVDTDFGCGVIHMSEPSNAITTAQTLDQVSEWSYYAANRKELLNLLTIEEFCTRYGFPIPPEASETKQETTMKAKATLTTPVRATTTDTKAAEEATKTTMKQKPVSATTVRSTAWKNYYLSRLQRRNFRF